MLAALLLNIPDWGGKIHRKPSHGWLKQQNENAKLAQDDEDLLNIVVSLVTTGEM